MKNVLKKLTNTKVLMGVAGATVLILTNVGVKVDNEVVNNVVTGVCTIGVLLGIMNDEGTKTTKWNK